MMGWQLGLQQKLLQTSCSCAATNLKVIGRAGIGVDNIDLKVAASKKGVIVMNTPFGNMITTAEHAIAMMFCSRPANP